MFRDFRDFRDAVGDIEETDGALPRCVAEAVRFLSVLVAIVVAIVVAVVVAIVVVVEIL